MRMNMKNGGGKGEERESEELGVKYWHSERS